MSTFKSFKKLLPYNKMFNIKKKVFNVDWWSVHLHVHVATTTVVSVGVSFQPCYLTERKIYFN